MKKKSDAVDLILSQSNIKEQLKDIINKVKNKERLTTSEGIYLFEEVDLSVLGVLANYVREEKNDNFTYFNNNFHLEPTNVCIYDCSFCSYSRKIKKREDGWELDLDEMLDAVKKYDDKPVTEVHIVGGVLPQYDLKFYTSLFSSIKKHRPELHIKALTPVEYHYIFKKDKISYKDGMKAMLDSGLDSLPGGGAEIFDEELHKKIAGGKCTPTQWLEIHEIWHNMGKRSNATMLYGHIESVAHRIDHMDRLRKLQDKTGGFQTFIPLKFRNKNNEMSHLDEVTVLDDLRNYAVSRIFLDNFQHIKAYWPMIGVNTTILSLAYGVDDIDGTIDDTTKIYSMAGAEDKNPSLSTYDLVSLIKSVGRHPIERNTLYDIVKDYNDVEFEEDKLYRGYVSLPVTNK